MASITPAPAKVASSTLRHYGQSPSVESKTSQAFTYTVPRRVSESVDDAIYIAAAANQYVDPDDRPCLTGRAWCCCRVAIGVSVAGIVAGIAYALYAYTSK